MINSYFTPPNVIIGLCGINSLGASDASFQNGLGLGYRPTRCHSTTLALISGALKKLRLMLTGFYSIYSKWVLSRLLWVLLARLESGPNALDTTFSSY